jgi:hypothetical protein
MALLGGNKQSPLEEMHAQFAALQADNAELRAWVEHLRGAGANALEAELRQLTAVVAQRRADVEDVVAEGRAAATELAALRQDVVETREVLLLQQVGVYDYRHPLEDAPAYKAALTALKTQIKAAASSDAVSCEVNWAVNGSQREGAKMGRDIAKLMLRAYNADADNAVRTVKPHTLDATVARLSKGRDAIAKLGAAMQIVISPSYHALRVQELELTADYLVKVEEERERQRAERERLRDEEKARREIDRERARLAKERSHYASVLARLHAAGASADDLAKTQAQLTTLDDAIAGVEARAANTRAGYVYVISNVGSFGPDVVKIGMTRRLDPMDRVRELGDASVPFRFDVHALIFHEDAVGLETWLHQQFAPFKVNLVNSHREFFYCTPIQVRDALMALGDGHMLEFSETAEAIEFRASDPVRRGFDVPDLAVEHPDARTPSLNGTTQGMADVREPVRAGRHSYTDAGVDGDLSDDGLGD